MSQCIVADKTKLSDQEWEAIAAQLKKIAGIHHSQSASCRRFIEAVLWVLRVGGQWRSLPADRGNWNSVFNLDSAVDRSLSSGEPHEHSLLFVR